MVNHRFLDMNHIRGNIEGNTFLLERYAMYPSEEWRVDMVDRSVFPLSSGLFKGGKWVLKATEENIDDAWDQINEFMDHGCFSYAKCSTRAGSWGFDQHMICVYNDDITDTEYIEAMGDLLSTVENIDEIGYKPNASTALGIYGENEYIYQME